MEKRRHADRMAISDGRTQENRFLSISRPSSLAETPPTGSSQLFMTGNLHLSPVRLEEPINDVNIGVPMDVQLASGSLQPSVVTGDPVSNHRVSCEPKYLTSPSKSYPERVFTLHLARGSSLEYTDADFCDPPSLNGLISSPHAMFAIWDDASTSWKGESPLVIRGIPVAVKYWKTFYQSFKGRRAWETFKQNWASWQV